MDRGRRLIVFIGEFEPGRSAERRDLEGGEKEVRGNGVRSQKVTFLRPFLSSHRQTSRNLHGSLLGRGAKREREKGI